MRSKYYRTASYTRSWKRRNIGRQETTSVVARSYKRFPNSFSLTGHFATLAFAPSASRPRCLLQEHLSMRHITSAGPQAYRKYFLPYQCTMDRVHGMPQVFSRCQDFNESWVVLRRPRRYSLYRFFFLPDNLTPQSLYLACLDCLVQTSVIINIRADGAESMISGLHLQSLRRNHVLYGTIGVQLPFSDSEESGNQREAKFSVCLVFEVESAFLYSATGVIYEGCCR